MGNAYGYVKNDTDTRVNVYVFNYSDGIRLVPYDYKEIGPWEKIGVEALAHGSGLIVATGKGGEGHHMCCPNGGEVKISELRKQPGNGWFTSLAVLTSVATLGAAAPAMIVGGLGAKAEHVVQEVVQKKEVMMRLMKLIEYCDGIIVHVLEKLPYLLGIVSCIIVGWILKELNI